MIPLQTGDGLELGKWSSGMEICILESGMEPREME